VSKVSFPLDGLHYAAEKFAVAVHEMAVSEAPLRQRIRDAWDQFHPVGEEDFPEGSTVRSEFVALRARTTWCEGKNGEGTLDATLAVISDRECRRLVHLICDVHTGIEMELSAWHSNRLHETQMRLGALLGPLPSFLDPEWPVPMSERDGSG